MGLVRRASYRNRSTRLRVVGQTWWLLTLAVLSLSCIGDRADTCLRRSDCPKGFCSGAGFCEAECSDDRDCPCGSFCAQDCQICLRNDRTDPATCFAYDRGLSKAEIFGACRSASPDGSSNAQPSIVVCILEVITPQVCALRATVAVDTSLAAADVPTPGLDAQVQDTTLVPDGGVDP
jgi:hypothetical protein